MHGFVGATSIRKMHESRGALSSFMHLLAFAFNDQKTSLRHIKQLVESIDLPKLQTSDLGFVTNGANIASGAKADSSENGC
jgi:hypothetical protein